MSGGRARFGALAILPILAVTVAAPRAPGSSSYHGTVSFAQPVDSVPNYIFPMTPAADFTGQNVLELQYLLWRPLYWFGNSGKPLFNPQLSLANSPVYSNGGRTVTISLKPSRWSDGLPVTTRDVRFWMDILLADKTKWGAYVPGGFADAITHIAYLSPSRFAITFNRAYNHDWLLYNELAQIIPIPQQTWDRTSLHGAVGNYDETLAGAHAVYAFLNKQSITLTTWDTSPLWKVVDGPWQLQPSSGFDPTTGFVTLVPNPAYAGPVKPTIARIEEVPFSSETAEFDALRAGTITYGYLPIEDLSQRSYMSAHGYRFEPWVNYGMSFVAINFTNPHTGPVLKQLYVRQAMEHLINQSQWVTDIFHGYGWPTYGPVPTRPGNPFADAYEHHTVYPYSVQATTTLLRQHGWHVTRSGTDTCVSPGSGPRNCGIGVVRGTPLSLHLLYSAGILLVAEEVQALKSAFSEAGINLLLQSAPTNTVFADYAPCVKATGAGCSWDLIDFFSGGISTVYYPDYFPTSGENFGTGGGFNTGGYSSAQADRLILATHVHPGLNPLYQDQNYLAQQLPVLWTPAAPIQFSEISTHLHGAVPQDPYGFLYPEAWTLRG